MKILPGHLEFEWDTGNTDKNWIKHKVTNKEAEEVFENNPKFISEDAKHSKKERNFWAKTDTSAYFDWNQAEEVIFPNLKPSTRKISLRLPDYLLWRIKQLDNAKDVPYQSLMKIFLAERVEKELR